MWNVSKSFWIGANDIDIEYDWVWESDKSKLVFRYWYVGEPNSVNEDCAILRKLNSLYKLLSAEDAFISNAIYKF
jgi:hypothetical protein